MIFTEFNMDDALEVAREEGVEQGLEKALRVAKRALASGADPEDIASDLELPLSKVLEIKEMGMSIEETAKAAKKTVNETAAIS